MEIEVKSGSLFFYVSEPLKEDETLYIRTSTMMVGIRGTSGWVTAADSMDRVHILDGTVTVAVGETEMSVSGGEMVFPSQDGASVIPYTQEQISPFVPTELEKNEALREKILAETGMDVLVPPP